jgi:hypothetical protein
MPPLPTLRRSDIVPHCNDVNVRVGRRHIILANMSRMHRRVRTGFRCAATCRELAPPLDSTWKFPLEKSLLEVSLRVVIGHRRSASGKGEQIFQLLIPRVK